MKDFDTVQNAVKDIQKGMPVILLDHREHEGDLVIAAEKATTKTVNDMLMQGRGVLCVSMKKQRFDALGLTHSSTIHNLEATHFGPSVDLNHTITTGVSAYDRAVTIMALASADTNPEDLDKNGHVRTLQAVEGGVLQRSGHTEASIALCELAGCRPVAAIIEILRTDGMMARKQDLLDLAQERNYKIITVNQILQELSKTDVI